MTHTEKEVCTNSLCRRFLIDLVQGVVSDTDASKDLRRKDIELATEEAEANEQLLDSSNFDVCIILSTSRRKT